MQMRVGEEWERKQLKRDDKMAKQRPPGMRDHPCAVDTDLPNLNQASLSCIPAPIRDLGSTSPAEWGGSPALWSPCPLPRGMGGGGSSRGGCAACRGSCWPEPSGSRDSREDTVCFALLESSLSRCEGPQEGACGGVLARRRSASSPYICPGGLYHDTSLRWRLCDFRPGDAGFDEPGSANGGGDRYRSSLGALVAC